MKAFFQKYGRIALALLLIFASGQVVGWVLALRSCQASTPAQTDTDVWAQDMLARLRTELDLQPDQLQRAETALVGRTKKIERERDRAMLQIHLELLKLHDDLEPGLTPPQKIKLADSRKKLRESINRKFASLLSEPVPPPVTDAPTPLE